ncbi:MAG: DedA family protein [Christensenellales bacterium]|jgi:membrane protein DedA with SNARE-associated domain
MNHSVEVLLRQTLSGLESIPVLYQLLTFYTAAVLQIVFGLPGDIVLMLGSFLSGVIRLPGGSWTVFGSYLLGTCTGGFALFELGRHGGSRLLRSAVAARLPGRAARESARRIAERYGKYVFLFSKFIPGVNAITIITGGALCWKRSQSYLCIAAAALGHNLLLFLAGRAVGNNLDAIVVFLADYSRIAALALGGILAAALVVWLIIRRRHRVAGFPGDAL